jgi:hypothetical protein
MVPVICDTVRQVVEVVDIEIATTITSPDVTVKVPEQTDPEGLVQSIAGGRSRDTGCFIVTV